MAVSVFKFWRNYVFNYFRENCFKHVLSKKCRLDVATIAFGKLSKINEHFLKYLIKFNHNHNCRNVGEINGIFKYILLKNVLAKELIQIHCWRLRVRLVTKATRLARGARPVSGDQGRGYGTSRLRT